MNRREMLSGAAAMVSSASASVASAKRMTPIPPGIKIGVSANTPSPEHMAYLKQLGVKWLSLAVNPAKSTAEDFIAQKAEWEKEGFGVYNIGSGAGPSGSLHNMPEVTLNLPGRDQKIEEYLNYIRYLGKAKVPYSTYAHMGERDLVERSGDGRAWLQRAGREREQSGVEGVLGREDLYGAVVARAGV